MSHSRIEKDQDGRERDHVRRDHKPDLDVEQPGEARDAGWSQIRWRRFDTSTHPQETTGNSIDLGHFTQIHGFVDASITRAIEVEGPLLTISYRAHRPLPMPAVPVWEIPADYSVYVWGLGYSQVDVRIDALRLEIRVWVLPVPR